MKFSLGKLLILTGIGSISISILLLAITFFPVLAQEIAFTIDAPDPSTKVVLNKQRSEGITEADSIFPVDDSFSVIIPKISANARIAGSVDPFNLLAYKKVLEKGIAHSDTSGKPGEGGFTFLFAHSGVNFYEAIGQNVRFYLLNKLATGDTIYVAYQEKLFTYQVYDTKVVAPDQVQYITAPPADRDETLVLMTCTPAGTPISRLLVFAELTTTS